MLNLHVLLVDDERYVRESIAALLERDPFFIARTCAAGSEALAAAREWRPDMMLLDVEMPGMDGPTVLAQLRVDKRTAPIPVVFLAKHPRKRERDRLKALGAAGVIAKPIDADALVAKVRSFVAVDGVLAPARKSFLQRLEADAAALSACRLHLTRTRPETTLAHINRIAHALAGAGGIFGFAGITCESAALSMAAESNLAGRAKSIEVERALDRLLERIGPQQRKAIALPRGWNCAC